MSFVGSLFKKAPVIGTLRQGDHLVTQRNGYTHHGIYVGGGRVIHFNGSLSSKRDAAIVKVTLRTFRQGRKFYVAHYESRYSAKQIIKRAHKCLGDEGYNVVFNNCEQFATWCRTNKKKSEQVENVIKALLATVLITIGRLVARSHDRSA